MWNKRRRNPSFFIYKIDSVNKIYHVGAYNIVRI